MYDEIKWEYTGDGPMASDSIASIKGVLILNHLDQTFGVPRVGSGEFTVEHLNADQVFPLVNMAYGIHGVRPHTGFGASIGQWHNGQSYLIVPYPVVMLATAIWPALRLRLRAKRGMKFGCAVCGYDLRATPDRCPECGKAVPKQE